jgi:two-component system nitrogen regulation response regulator GlnG
MSDSASPTVLIIDDDSEIRYSLDRVLSARNYHVVTASSGEKGIEMAEEVSPVVIFLDNRMEGMSGIETLQHLRSAAPHAMTILMTAFGTTQTAIEAMKYGAFDYIVKPFDVKKVLALTEKAILANADLVKAKQAYTPILNSDDYKEGIVGQSEPMQEVFKIIGQVAASDATVMITGESGTGKELIARAICQHSLRSGRPYQAVNCAAIPENLIESELFGHEKGSFTGATQQRAGKFELCHGGTLFLDEIGDMELATQTKILRALQEGEIQRVGGNEPIKVDVRVIAATNKDLEKMIAEKTFREDLYYRLNVVRIRLPALRERAEDIPALVDFIIQRMVKNRKTRVRQVSADALDLLKRYPWPGNVRELENVIQRAAVVAQGDTILTKDLPGEILVGARGVAAAAPAPSDTPVERPKVETIPPFPVAEESPAEKSTRPEAPAESPVPVLNASTPASSNGAPVALETAYDQLFTSLRASTDENILQEIERAMIERVLRETGGNQVKASAILGITRATLRKRIDQMGLSL